MKFSEVIGHNDIKERFVRGIRGGRISHAQMFCGTPGTGALALALAYAQYVNCRQPSQTDACGQCPSCHKIQKLIHPDLHFVFPVVKTSRFKEPVSDNYLTLWREFLLQNQYQGLGAWIEKMEAENQQAGIFTHESREILRKMSLKTFEADYKIMIVWQPEKMHVSCANKLLKIIEEPPAKTLFLLVSEEPEQVLQTIRSRTQMVQIPRIAQADMEQLLTDSERLAAFLPVSALSSGDIPFFIKMANGNLETLIELINASEANRRNFDWFVSLMRSAFGAGKVGGEKALELLAWADRVSGTGREVQKSFLQYALKMLRENFMLNISGNNDRIVYLSTQEREFSGRFYPYIHQGNIMGLYEEFNRACYHIERMGNDKIVLLDLALRITKLLKTDNLQSA